VLGVPMAPWREAARYRGSAVTATPHLPHRVPLPAAAQGAPALARRLLTLPH
jgi:hypothetical protein